MTDLDIDEAGAIDLLERLVATPSPPRREQAAVGLLVDWMAEHGLASAPDDAGNAVGVRGAGPREILLLGHIDTFPGTVPVRREGRLLSGRGTVDAKGPLAAFATAAAAVIPPSDWRITVVGAVEEESTTSRGARHLVASRRQVNSPEAVIVGEPSRWDRVALGYRGSVELRLGLRAPFTHSAGPSRLPAERAVELWQAVQEHVDGRNRERGAGEFNRYAAALRSIRTRDAGSFGEASLRVGLRLPPGETLEALQRDLRSSLQERVRSWNAAGRTWRCSFAADRKPGGERSRPGWSAPFSRPSGPSRAIPGSWSRPARPTSPSWERPGPRLRWRSTDREMVCWTTRRMSRWIWMSICAPSGFWCGFSTS